MKHIPIHPRDLCNGDCQSTAGCSCCDRGVCLCPDACHVAAPGDKPTPAEIVAEVFWPVLVAFCGAAGYLTLVLWARQQIPT